MEDEITRKVSFLFQQHTVISGLLDSIYEETVIKRLKENQDGKLLVLRDVIRDHIMEEEKILKRIVLFDVLDIEKEHRRILDELNDLIVFSRRNEIEIMKIEKLFKLINEHKRNEEIVLNRS